ncbi:MAG: hypothetical protein SGJ19_02195, partial [Planctomycetia bacterium]|nr:hypothetical protein [Planctomycetia bacterium]
MPRDYSVLAAIQRERAGRRVGIFVSVAACCAKTASVARVLAAVCSINRHFPDGLSREPLQAGNVAYFDKLRPPRQDCA